MTDPGRSGQGDVGQDTTSVSGSAGQSTLTAHTTKQEIALANQLESYKCESAKKAKEMQESIKLLKQKLIDTEARMGEQADLFNTMLETNTRLVNEKIDLVDKNNGLHMDRME